METTMATSTQTARTGARTDRTPAQWFALLVGGVLVVAGLAGFVADASFATGSGVQGDELLGLEVNGLHNVVHIASGALLLALAPRAGAARAGVLAFGVVYALVTAVGLVDGDDVLGLIPVNAADNVLHLALTAVALLAAFASRD
jgi:Domain of unknown function (DUF4383)